MYTIKKTGGYCITEIEKFLLSYPARIRVSVFLIANSRRYVVAIDRSTSGGLEVYGVTVVRVDSQGVLIRYSDFFKHLRRLGSRRMTYVPRMLRVIRRLVEEDVVVGLRVFTRLDDALEAVRRRRVSIRACVVDDNAYNYYTTSGVKAKSYLYGVPLVLVESMLREPSSTIVDKVREAGLTMVFLRVLVSISDNIANYARRVFESQVQALPVVWKL